jgi:hypothetical protein
MFDLQWLTGLIFDGSGMNFTEEGGRKGCPINRSFETGKVDDEGLHVRHFTYFGGARFVHPVDNIQDDRLWLAFRPTFVPLVHLPWLWEYFAKGIANGAANGRANGRCQRLQAVI